MRYASLYKIEIVQYNLAQKHILNKRNFVTVGYNAFFQQCFSQVSLLSPFQHSPPPVHFFTVCSVCLTLAGKEGGSVPPPPLHGQKFTLNFITAQWHLRYVLTIDILKARYF
jgi:hypothetical protein